MAFLVREAQNLRFNGRAVTGADTFDNAVGHRGAFHIVPQDFMGFFVGIGQITGNLLAGHFITHKGEVAAFLVTGLNFHLAVIEGARIYAGRRTRLKAHQLNADFFERIGELHRRPLSGRAALVGVLADNDTALEICTRSHNDSLGRVDFTGFGLYARNFAVFDQQFVDKELFNIQIFRLFAGFLHRELIELFIGLCAQGMDSRAFARVEHAELNAGLVGIDAHFPA